MAITAIEYKLLRDLRRARLLPKNPHVVEFGEANWYGDVPKAMLFKDLDELLPDAAVRAAARGELEALFARHEGGDEDALFAVARIFYRAILEPASWTAVDMGGTERALKLDLNRPVDLGRTFDVVLNFGTAEHIFDIAQFFRTMHAVARPGALMIHACPFWGWLDHGFWNIQPTVYVDLAQANSYRVRGMFLAQINPPRLVQMRGREHILEMGRDRQLGENAVYVAVLQKSETEAEFQVPMQGYYAGALSDEAAQLWGKLR